MVKMNTFFARLLHQPTKSASLTLSRGAHRSEWIYLSETTKSANESPVIFQCSLLSLGRSSSAACSIQTLMTTTQIFQAMSNSLPAIFLPNAIEGIEKWVTYDLPVTTTVESAQPEITELRISENGCGTDTAQLQCYGMVLIQSTPSNNEISLIIR
jgi:hypothetical protein